MDRCFTFVIESMLTFPTSYPSYIRTRSHLSPIKINQNNLLQEKKSSGTSAIPRKKIANRQTLFFINSSMEKMIQVCNRFCLFLYSRLPPRQYMTRVWPIKGGLYLLGASFWSQTILIYLKKLLSDYNIYIQYINTLVISSRFQIYVFKALQWREIFYWVV